MAYLACLVPLHSFQGGSAADCALPGALHWLHWHASSPTCAPSSRTLRVLAVRSPLVPRPASGRFKAGAPKTCYHGYAQKAALFGGRFKAGVSPDGLLCHSDLPSAWQAVPLRCPL